MPGPRPTLHISNCSGAIRASESSTSTSRGPQFRPPRRRVPNFSTAMRGKSGSG
jgi:hypothetical protein